MGNEHMSETSSYQNKKDKRDAQALAMKYKRDVEALEMKYKRDAEALAKKLKRDVKALERKEENIATEVETTTESKEDRNKEEKVDIHSAF